MRRGREGGEGGDEEREGMRRGREGGEGGDEEREGGREGGKEEGMRTEEWREKATQHTQGSHFS